MKRVIKWLLFTGLVLLTILITGLLLPENFTMPVKGAKKRDYRQDSFWYYPWGKSGVHKGVDIFAKEGTPVVASTTGLVWSTGYHSQGGNYVTILGPKWHFHYYAHLKTIRVTGMSFVSRGDVIGAVGTTGNAKGKPAHLHYTITTLFPHFWLRDNAPQGGKKMWFLNPTEYLNKACK